MKQETEMIVHRDATRVRLTSTSSGAMLLSPECAPWLIARGHR